MTGDRVTAQAPPPTGPGPGAADTADDELSPSEWRRIARAIARVLTELDAEDPLRPPWRRLDR